MSAPSRETKSLITAAVPLSMSAFLFFVASISSTDKMGRLDPVFILQARKMSHQTDDPAWWVKGSIVGECACASIMVLGACTAALSVLGSNFVYCSWCTVVCRKSGGPENGILAGDKEPPS